MSLIIKYRTMEKEMKGQFNTQITTKVDLNNFGNCA